MRNIVILFIASIGFCVSAHASDYAKIRVCVDDKTGNGNIKSGIASVTTSWTKTGIRDLPLTKTSSTGNVYCSQYYSISEKYPNYNFAKPTYYAIVGFSMAVQDEDYYPNYYENSTNVYFTKTMEKENYVDAISLNAYNLDLERNTVYMCRDNSSEVPTDCFKIPPTKQPMSLKCNDSNYCGNFVVWYRLTSDF
jgi:hypothetical protein